MVVVRAAMGLASLCMAACTFDSSGGGEGNGDLGSSGEGADESTTSSGAGPTGDPGPGSGSAGPTGDTNTGTVDTTMSMETGTAGCVESTWWVDADGDGWGDEGQDPITACDQPPGYVGQGGDCDDGNSSRNPGLDELCDDFDNDCDNKTDEHSAANTACKGCVSTEVDGVAFYVCPFPTAWETAREVCEDDHYGDLATVRAAADETAIVGLMQTAFVADAWIGFNDLESEGTFVWVDGTPVDYVNWQQTQPDNYDGIQHCVIVAVESGEWFDRHCPNQLHQFVDSFVCADPEF